MIWDSPDRYDADIAKALVTPGGHLSIGRGGFSLHYESSTLSGYDCEFIKQVAIAAGLPVIDSRMVPFDLAAKLAVNGPMIAVNEPPRPRPWHAFSYAPLEAVGAAYRKAGAEVFNLPENTEYDGLFDAVPKGPESSMVDFWLSYVRAHGEQGDNHE
jgi:hypothetical protein